jgi:nucleoside-triphosphatase THEP1
MCTCIGVVRVPEAHKVEKIRRTPASSTTSGTSSAAIPSRYPCREPFGILHHLVRHGGRLVSKRELAAELWPGKHLNESVLPVHMRAIRRMLGDTPSGAIIRTIRGHGYVVICPVEKWRGPSVRAAGRTSPAFVGRGPLMDGLRDAFDQAVGGEGRIVLLSGDAGIGKTQILDEFCGWLRDRHATVLVIRIRCDAESRAVQFECLTRLLEAGRDALAREPLRPRTRRYGFAADRLLERVAALLRSGEALPGAAALRVQLIRLLGRAVERITRALPAVVVIDDMQHMDESSLTVWQSLARGVKSSRLLLVSAHRQRRVGLEHPIARVLGTLATEPGLRPITVGPLDRAAVEELTREHLQREVDSAFIHALLARTDGNPYFVREVLRSLTADGAPRSERLPDVAHVEISVAGRELLLEEISGCPRLQLLELLCEGVGAQIIAPDSGAPSARLALGCYGFANPLIRDAIYMEISRPEWALRHRAVAEALGRLAGRVSGEQIYELAYHCLEAAPAGDVDRASEACAEAGRWALSRHDHEKAIEHFEGALRAEALRSPPDPIRACSLTIELADALRDAGRCVRARAHYDGARAAARTLDRPDLLARCALGAMTSLSIIGGRLALPRSGPERWDGRQQLLELADEALGALGDASDPVRSRLLAMKALVAVGESRWGSAVLSAEQAGQLAQSCRDVRARFDALLAKRAFIRLPQDASRGLEVATELVALARESAEKPRSTTSWPDSPWRGRSGTRGSSVPERSWTR